MNKQGQSYPEQQTGQKSEWIEYVIEIQCLGLDPKPSDWMNLGKFPHFSELFPHRKMEVTKIFIPQDCSVNCMINLCESIVLQKVLVAHTQNLEVTLYLSGPLTPILLISLISTSSVPITTALAAVFMTHPQIALVPS